MSERSVDLSFLQKAVARLDAGLTRYRQDIHDEQIRDGRMVAVGAGGFQGGSVAEFGKLKRSS